MTKECDEYLAQSEAAIRQRDEARADRDEAKAVSLQMAEVAARDFRAQRDAVIAERDRLAAALRPFAKRACTSAVQFYPEGQDCLTDGRPPCTNCRARAALAGPSGDRTPGPGKDEP